MATAYEVEAGRLIETVAKDLRDNVKLEKPKWADFVKTGSHKEKQPDDDNWWWMRSASILRHVYMKGPVGIQRLRKLYGGRKNRGVRPEKFRKGGGKNIRTILQDLDKLEFTEKTSRGRKVTPKGRSYLDKISSDLLKKSM